MEEVTLPEGLESIGREAFQGNKLQSIVIPASVNDIGESAFYGNERLKEVRFAGNKIKVLPRRFARGCEQLSKNNIPEGMETISNDSLSWTALESITFPNTVKAIDSNALGYTYIHEATLPDGIKRVGGTEKDSSKFSNGVFFRTVKTKADKGKNTKDIYEYTRVKDKSGLATEENTGGVVNPQKVTINFVDEAGKSIKEAIEATGQDNLRYEKPAKYNAPGNFPKGTGEYLTDYVGKSSSEDLTSLASKVKDLAKVLRANYYKLNEQYHFKAPEISGYVAPPDIDKTITLDDHTVTFVYKTAASAKVIVEGDGVTISPKQDSYSKGEKLTVTIREHEGKTLEALTVNGENVTDKLSGNGIEYKYTFTLGDTNLIKATYKDSDAKNTFTLEPNKDSFKLGEKVKVSVKYRGKAVDPEDNNFTFESTDKDADLEVKEKTAPSLKLIKSLSEEPVKSQNILLRNAGEQSISLKYKGDKVAETKVTVDPIKVIVGIEDYDKTLIERAETTIDSLAVHAGERYYKDISFNEPVAFLGIEAALRANGVKTGDKTEFDCGDAGSWMIILGAKLPWSHASPKSSFFFFVNNEESDKTIEGKFVKEGDKIIVNRIYNYEKFAYSFLTPDQKTIKAGDDITFKLEKRDYKKNITPVAGARLEVNGKAVEGASGLTGTGGQISYRFDKAGIYKISAGLSDYSILRPYALIMVEEKPNPADKTKLNEAVTSAENAKKGVKVSTDGSDVDPKDKWATAEEIETFQDEIDNAKSIAESDDPATTQKVVDDTLKQLQTAKANFEQNLKAGTKKEVTPTPNYADLTALNKAIENAKTAIKDVKTSKDGKDIAKANKWVTPEAMKAMTDKIAEAEALVKTKPTVDKKADVEKMTADLKKLTEEFKPVAGLKDESKPNPDPTPTPGSGVTVKFADSADLNKNNNVVLIDGEYVYTKGVSKGLSYKITGTNPEHLISVSIDNRELVKDKDYTVVKGSILLNLKKETLDKLSNGRHTLTVKTKDGDVQTAFVVKEKKTDDNGTPNPTPNPNNNSGNKPDVKPGEKGNGNPSQPGNKGGKGANTGDNSMAVGYGMLAVVLTVAMYFVVRRKKNI